MKAKVLMKTQVTYPLILDSYNCITVDCKFPISYQEVFPNMIVDLELKIYSINIYRQWKTKRLFITNHYYTIIYYKSLLIHVKIGEFILTRSEKWVVQTSMYQSRTALMIRHYIHEVEIKI